MPNTTRRSTRAVVGRRPPPLRVELPRGRDRRRSRRPVARDRGRPSRARRGRHRLPPSRGGGRLDPSLEIESPDGCGGAIPERGLPRAHRLPAGPAADSRGRSRHRPRTGDRDRRRARRQARQTEPAALGRARSTTTSPPPRHSVFVSTSVREIATTRSWRSSPPPTSSTASWTEWTATVNCSVPAGSHVVVRWPDLRLRPAVERGRSGAEPGERAAPWRPKPRSAPAVSPTPSPGWAPIAHRQSPARRGPRARTPRQLRARRLRDHQRRRRGRQHRRRSLSNSGSEHADALIQAALCRLGGGNSNRPIGRWSSPLTAAPRRGLIAYHRAASRSRGATTSKPSTGSRKRSISEPMS